MSGENESINEHFTKRLEGVEDENERSRITMEWLYHLLKDDPKTRELLKEVDDEMEAEKRSRLCEKQIHLLQ